MLQVREHAPTFFFFWLFTLWDPLLALLKSLGVCHWNQQRNWNWCKWNFLLLFPKVVLCKLWVDRFIIFEIGVDDFQTKVSYIDQWNKIDIPLHCMKVFVSLITKEIFYKCSQLFLCIVNRKLVYQLSYFGVSSLCQEINLYLKSQHPLFSTKIPTCFFLY
jgi:hypothetical protein